MPFAPCATVSDVGEALTVKPGAVFVPVPVRLTVWGLVESASVITRLAVSTAATDGVKVTLIVHEVPAAMLVPHVFDGDAKSAFAAIGAPPDTTTPVNPIAAGELLVSVTFCAADVVPTNCWPNVNVSGDTVSVFWKVSSAINASDGPFSAVWKAPGFGTTVNDVAGEKVTPVT